MTHAKTWLVFPNLYKSWTSCLEHYLNSVYGMVLDSRLRASVQQRNTRS